MCSGSQSTVQLTNILTGGLQSHRSVLTQPECPWCTVCLIVFYMSMLHCVSDSILHVHGALHVQWYHPCPVMPCMSNDTMLVQWCSARPMVPCTSNDALHVQWCSSFSSLLLFYVPLLSSSSFTS